MSSARGPFVAARVRVTIDCPECASPIPVNGVVREVLCGACQAVVRLSDGLGWNHIFTYGSGEPCMEHKILMNNKPRAAMDYFLSYGGKGGPLYRKWRQILLEIDTRPIECPTCRHGLDERALATEAIAEAAAVDVFCPGCGGKVPIRAAEKKDQHMIHGSCVAIVCETAPREGLREASVEKILFSCLGCGAPSPIDETTPRVMKCEFCSATSYLPDALWLRLHPAQRKRPFYVILESTKEVLMEARRIVKG